MPISLIPSFLLYCFVGGITPGPANLCSLGPLCAAAVAGAVLLLFSGQHGAAALTWLLEAAGLVYPISPLIETEVRLL